MPKTTTCLACLVNPTRDCFFCKAPLCDKCAGGAGITNRHFFLGSCRLRPDVKTIPGYTPYEAE